MTLALVLACVMSAPPPDRLLDGFRSVPPDARMRMYWRVFGPAWTKPEIDYQLGILRDSGVGGVMAYFMYPVALDDPSKGILNQRFGSPEFLDTVGYASRKARSLDLRFAVNGSTGWPFGGPSVSPADAAQNLRLERDPAKVKPGEQVVARSSADRLYVAGPTGMNVKRPAFGAEGRVVSHFDAAPLARYLTAAVEPMLNADPGGIEAVGCDSLEAYDANWTADLPREFKKRRGYDLLPRLDELFDEQAAASKDLRFDYWRTLAELTEERFTKPLGDWAKAHHVGLEMEAYGTPPNPMTASRYISLPTGEHYEWKGFSVQKYVSSAADLTRRRVIGSEAWTWIGLPNRLADSLSDLKLCSDLTFLAGANDLTGVDFPYSPRSVGAPGWQPYYGPTMNQNNPQWRFFPAFVQYANRCQWLLRQGAPVRSVAVYLPVEDAMAEGPVNQMLLDFHVRDRLVTGKATSEFGLRNALVHTSEILHGLALNGYDYDGIDLWAMNRLARVAGKTLVAGDGHFASIILPNIERIDLAAMEKIAAFCRAGGLVVASRRLPNRVAGVAKPGEQERLEKLVAEMFGDGESIQQYGKGIAAFESTDEQAINILSAYAQPDVVFGPEQPEVGFVHRRDGKTDIYFLANTSNEPATFAFAMPGADRAVELWNPVSGTVTPVPIQLDEGRSVVSLGLNGRGSCFLVQRGPLRPVPPVAPVKWESRELSAEWAVSFDGPDAPPSKTVRELTSWTGWPGGAGFSGIGTYRTSIDWEGPPTRQVLLSFEQVHEAVELRVNGRTAGVLFSPPFALDIEPLLKTGRNEIEAIVGNLPVNRFISLPDENLAALRAVYGNRFPAPQEKQLMKSPAPSGLIGKVRLLVGR